MRSRLFLLPALLALGACADNAGTGVRAGGEYRVVLQSPHGAEGAASIQLEGGTIQSVAGEAGTRVFSQAAGGATHVVVVAEPAGELAFRLTLAPGSELPRAAVTQVVDGSDQPRGALGAYRVTFSR